MKPFNSVASRIIEFRTHFGSKGISQEALAAELGVARNTIGRWESGQFKPGLEDLEKLCVFFGKSFLDFFPEAGAPMNDNVAALMSAVSGLPDSEVEALRRDAEIRLARNLGESANGSRANRRMTAKGR